VDNSSIIFSEELVALDEEEVGEADKTMGPGKTSCVEEF
jgi:hypothetical protein